MRITRDQYNALLACMGKNDVRYYLNGIHINAETKKIESSEGHKLICVDVSDLHNFNESVIFRPSSRKAPAKTETVSILNIDDKKVSVQYIGKHNHVIEILICEKINANYPDFRKAIPNNQLSLDQIQVNPALMHDAIKEFKHKHIPKWDIYHNQLVCRSIKNVLIIIMCAIEMGKKNEGL